MRYWVALVIFAATVCVMAQTPTPHGVLVTMTDGHTVELAVEGMYSFRASVYYDGGAPAASASYMIAPHTQFATYRITQDGDTVGLATDFGAVTITPSGALVLTDSQVYQEKNNFGVAPYCSIFTGLLRLAGHRVDTHRAIFELLYRRGARQRAQRHVRQGIEF